MVKNMCVYCLKEKTFILESARFSLSRPDDKLITFRCTNCGMLCSIIFSNQSSSC